MSNWDNFAPWDNNDNNDNNQNNNTFDMQFNDIKRNLTNTYARDDINDKLNQRGYTPCAFPRNIHDNSKNSTQNLDNKNNTNSNIDNNTNTTNNNYEQFFGRLNSESSLRKMINNNEQKNQITEHQFFNSRGDFKYNAPPNSISSRNFNSKKRNEINEEKNKNINRDVMNNANTT